MELSPGECVVPLPVSESSQNGAGYENQNTEGAVESNVDIEPEMYDFSSFLESDIVDDAFLEFKEMLESASLPSFGHVVPEVIEELEVEKNMEQLVQTPSPPQQPENFASARPAARLRWTKELHASFVHATKQLGGAFIATPKTIRDIMKVEGLSLYQVKSHLQKYRLGKNPCQDWKTFCRRGPSFSRALGGPSKLVASSQPLQAKNQRRRRAKPNKHEKGSLYLKIEVQKHLQHLLEAQRVYAKIAAEGMASYQNTEKYPLAVNQNIRVFSFAADHNLGRNILSKNHFIGGATMAPVATFNPYELNLYNAYTSGAAINAGIFIARKPYQLQGIREAHPHLPFQASFRTVAASGSYAQGSNSASGESSGVAGMSDEEFVESILIDYEEIMGDSQKVQ